MFQNYSSRRDLGPVFRDLLPPPETGRVVWLIERRHRKVAQPPSPLPLTWESHPESWPRVEDWRPAGRIRAATIAEALEDARARFGPGCRHDVRVSGISTLGIDDSQK